MIPKEQRKLDNVGSQLIQKLKNGDVYSGGLFVEGKYGFATVNLIRKLEGVHVRPTSFEEMEAFFKTHDRTKQAFINVADFINTLPMPWHDVDGPMLPDLLDLLGRETQDGQPVLYYYSRKQGKVVPAVYNLFNVICHGKHASYRADFGPLIPLALEIP